MPLKKDGGRASFEIFKSHQVPFSHPKTYRGISLGCQLLRGVMTHDRFSPHDVFSFLDYERKTSTRPDTHTPPTMKKFVFDLVFLLISFCYFFPFPEKKSITLSSPYTSAKNSHINGLLN